jgi:hypothetical protein
MFRKTLITIAAAGTLALGMVSASSTANAGLSISVSGGNYHGWHDGYGSHCQIQRVKVRHHHRWVWRKIRSCHFHGRPILMHHRYDFGHRRHFNNW